MFPETIIILRALILSIGWPVLIVGSVMLSVLGWRFAKATEGTIFAKLVFPTVLGWLVTMYILGVTATFYMLDVPYKGTLIVFPVFIIWFIAFSVLVWITHRWSAEAITVKVFYENLEEEVKERTKELQQSNEHLREADQAKSQFVSIAAHQFRTPLSAIKWTINLILGGDLGDITKEQRVALEHGAESVERVIVLVGDLLNVARIESGQLIYTFETITLESLFDDLIKDANARLHEKGIALHVALPDSPLPEARGDRSKLLLAFQNVLENAIAYTPKHGVVSATLRKEDAQHYQVIIADTGMGIPRNQQLLLFQKFFRGDNVVRQQIAGTGLGLYITKRVIEAHGGTITVESEEQKGSTFTITIPFLTS